MQQSSAYEATFRASLRAQWDLDSVLDLAQELDFSRNFLPQSLARTDELASLSPEERRLLNQISAHQYLSLFVIVEQFILPFLLEHSREAARGDDYGMRALLNFAGEEVKHMQLFRRFLDAFDRGFPVRCEVIGPAEAIGAEVLRHHPIAVSFVVLMFEWMSQVHYVETIRDDSDVDPLFKSLMRHHWMEEAQHAKLDSLIIEALADRYSAQEIEGRWSPTQPKLASTTTLCGIDASESLALMTESSALTSWTTFCLFVQITCVPTVMSRLTGAKRKPSIWTGVASGAGLEARFAAWILPNRPWSSMFPSPGIPAVK